MSVGVSTPAGHETKKSAGFLARSVISQALQETLNLEHIVRLSLDSLKPTFHGAVLACALRSSDGGSVDPIWVNTDSNLGEQFLDRGGLLWEASKAAIQADTSEMPSGYQHVLIENEIDTFGVLLLSKGDRGMLELLKILAEGIQEVAVQIEETSDVHRLTRELEILNRTAKSLTTSLNLDTILVAIMQGVWELFPNGVAILTLLDFDHDDLYIKIPLTGEPDHVIRYEPEDASGVVGDCIDHRATSIVPDVENDSRYDGDLDSEEGLSTRSLMCVPLLTHDRALGAISILSEDGDAFTKKDLDLLVAFGASVSVSISNARYLHDVTTANADLEDSRREIEHSRNTLLALFDNLDDELYIINRDYELIAVNQARAKRAEAAPQALVTRKCYQVLEGRESPCPACLAIETFEIGQKTMRIENSIGEDHQFIIREIYTYPINDADGNVFQSIHQIRDITERRRLETSLIQAEKLAALGQLSAGVAHELNNPITAVIANTQLLKRELKPIEVDSESVDLIEQAGRRAQKVVRALLDFSRQEPYEFQSVNVNHSIQQALALVEKQWEKANVKLVQELSDDLPMIHGNTDHLQSVWINLLVNARDALGDLPGEVTLRSEEVGNYVVVQVLDTGAGIPQEYLNRIFDPFFTTKAPGKGTGLGLATCFRIVDQHRGTIEVDSTLNVGTTFTVKLPIEASANSSK
jgi:two-component system NtrC family sensor kinase